MFKHLYQNPSAAISLAEGNEISDEELKEVTIHLEKFYEEIFLELSNFGELKDLFVLDNLCEHLIGNVYAKFSDEKSAKNAYDSLQGKYYHSDLVVEEYCPIINVKDGKCYKNEDGLCNKGAYCNFFHFKEISKSLIKSLKDEQYEIHPEYRKNRFNNNNNNNYLNKKKQKRHENTSSESSLDRYDRFTRKRIIHRWNNEYIAQKKIDDLRKKLEKSRSRHRSHRKHKDKKKHKHKHRHHHHHHSNSYDDEYDNDKLDKLKKKEYKEDLISNNSTHNEKNYKEKKSESFLTEKSGFNNYENDKSEIEKKSKSKITEKKENEEKGEGKEINEEMGKKIDSDEEETISAGDFEQN